MPIITIKLAKGRTAEQKQKFVERVTQEAINILNVEKEWVTIIFEEHDRENWATGGELHSVKFGEGFGKTSSRK